MDATPAVVASCPRPERVSPQHVQELLAAMRGKLPHTSFLSARPAPVCGLVQLDMGEGRVAFTDTSGRYLLVGLLLDTATGRVLPSATPADDPQEFSR